MATQELSNDATLKSDGDLSIAEQLICSGLGFLNYEFRTGCASRSYRSSMLSRQSVRNPARMGDRASLAGSYNNKSEYESLDLQDLMRVLVGNKKSYCVVFAPLRTKVSLVLLVPLRVLQRSTERFFRVTEPCVIPDCRMLQNVSATQIHSWYMSSRGFSLALANPRSTQVTPATINKFCRSTGFPYRLKIPSDININI
ncbi:hypothetical protein WN51_00092 [Melipona quadrifasciata]|uniref:Uncharacterized protein n=1 Tax=Melipona quadrifasciata TaxID=166423 RepID=A0A0M9ABK0_9HYME|nr:hypothetical protein WN51_00092 [Melipona quadrifasciata]